MIFSISILPNWCMFGSSSAEAGLMSGSTGIESVPGPELPKIEFLDRLNGTNFSKILDFSKDITKSVFVCFNCRKKTQKFYAENDSRFKESPLVKKLLEKSKLNKEKNEREIQDKYCLRGAEWGVGDCSTTGMTDEEKEKFITMLKEKTDVK